MMASTLPRASQALPDSLCVAVAASTADELLQRSAALLPDFPFQELRLDSLADPATILPALAEHTAAYPQAAFLATCRRTENGGTFAGSAQQEHHLLAAAARACGCRLVDLSLETAEALGTQSVAELQRVATVVLSWHDFQGTPDLDAVYARMRPFAPDIYKIVPTATCLRDNLGLFRLLQSERGRRGLVMIAMGEAGLISRVLSPHFGAAFTFAAPDDRTATAPGQLTAAALRDRYRLRELTEASRILAVAGSPIRSSLSPQMHNAALQALGLDAVYVPLLTASAEELMEIVRALPLEGCSVTMPLKQGVMPHLARIDPLARRIGAVNTLRRRAEGAYEGFNTDVAGIVQPLQQRLSLKGARILVLGAGGAARAAVFGCVDRGARVSILNRTPAAALQLAKDAGAEAITASAAAAAQPFDVLIQATPAGMRGNAAELPLASELLPARLIFDLVYNPLETPLLAAARAQGLATIQGVEMFVHQGARQFELWTGQAAPTPLMEAAVRSALV